MRYFALTGILTALLTLSAAAQDAVEIKLAKPKAGDQYKVTKTEKTKNIQVADFGGMKKNKDSDETKEIVYTEEIVTLGTGDEKPVKVIRTYSKYEDKSEKNRPTPPLGTAITVEKKDGKYTFVASKPLGEFAQTLEDEFTKPTGGPTTQDFQPGKAVKPGDTWKIDTAMFIKGMGDKIPIDTEKSTVSAKLLKTYKKDGKQFGVLELKAELSIKELGKGAPPLKDGNLKMTITTDVCLDGSTFAESSKTAISLDILVDTKEVYLSMKANGIMTEIKEPLPKK